MLLNQPKFVCWGENVQKLGKGTWDALDFLTLSFT